ncbi:hypothetical protein HAX54_033190, partial [Datura stramonium]|nr:hypothetical protein [Datura stramonium]
PSEYCCSGGDPEYYVGLISKDLLKFKEIHLLRKYECLPQVAVWKLVKSSNVE